MFFIIIRIFISIFHSWVMFNTSSVYTSKGNKQQFAKWKNVTGKNNPTSNRADIPELCSLTDKRIELNSGVGDLASNFPVRRN